MRNLARRTALQLMLKAAGAEVESLAGRRCTSVLLARRSRSPT